MPQIVIFGISATTTLTAYALNNRNEPLLVVAMGGALASLMASLTLL